MSQEEEKRVRDGVIFAIAAHYDRNVSTGSVQIENIKRLNIDDWQVQAKCRRRSKELHVEVIVFCNAAMFDLISFYEIGQSI